MGKSYSEGAVKRLIRAAGRLIKKAEPAWAAKINLANHLFLTDFLYTHPDYPRSLPSVSVLFVSDVHYGALYSERQGELLRKGMALLPADLLLFGGDFGDTPEDSLRFIETFPVNDYPMGVYSVFGNHDLQDSEKLSSLRTEVKRRGWQPLENDGLPLNEGLYLCGVEDFKAGKPDIENALKRRPGSGICLLASHNPDVLASCGRLPFQLALCGHTHGGQISVKGHSIISSSQYRDRYRSGWYFENGHDILVTNGIGTSLLPIRFGAEPQLIRLRIGHGEHAHELLEHRDIYEENQGSGGSGIK